MCICSACQAVLAAAAVPGAELGIVFVFCCYCCVVLLLLLLLLLRHLRRLGVSLPTILRVFPSGPGFENLRGLQPRIREILQPEERRAPQDAENRGFRGKRTRTPWTFRTVTVHSAVVVFARGVPAEPVAMWDRFFRFLILLLPLERRIDPPWSQS